MTDPDFIAAAAAFLAGCSPEQRSKLVDMAENFGQSPSGTADHAGGRSGARAALSLDALNRSDPDRGKTFDERFPHSSRLA